MSQLRILWLASAVGEHHDDQHQATSDSMIQSVLALQQLGHKSLLLLPSGSTSALPHRIIPGTYQAMLPSPDAQKVSSHDALLGMLDYAFQHRSEYDLVVNIGHEWLPYAMQSFFLDTPLVNIPNLCRTSSEIDQPIADAYRRAPHQTIFISEFQKHDLVGRDSLRNVVFRPFNAMDFRGVVPDDSRPAYLAWAGRIFPHKGLDSALSVARQVGIPLHVAGRVQDRGYFERLTEQYPDILYYQGLLGRRALYDMLAGAKVFLQLQDGAIWNEAFGRITAEALLSGCPVVANRCGANPELVSVTGGGQVVDTVAQAVQAVRVLVDLPITDRVALQQRALAAFSHEAVGTKLEAALLQACAPRLKNDGAFVFP